VSLEGLPALSSAPGPDFSSHKLPSREHFDAEPVEPEPHRGTRSNPGEAHRHNDPLWVPHQDQPDRSSSAANLSSSAPPPTSYETFANPDRRGPDSLSFEEMYRAPASSFNQPRPPVSAFPAYATSEQQQQQRPHPPRRFDELDVFVGSTAQYPAPHRTDASSFDLPVSLAPPLSEGIGRDRFEVCVCVRACVCTCLFICAYSSAFATLHGPLASLQVPLSSHPSSLTDSPLWHRLAMRASRPALVRARWQHRLTQTSRGDGL
jgi:hypothetical protein